MNDDDLEALILDALRAAPHPLPITALLARLPAPPPAAAVQGTLRGLEVRGLVGSAQFTRGADGMTIVLWAAKRRRPRGADLDGPAPPAPAPGVLCRRERERLGAKMREVAHAALLDLSTLGRFERGLQTLRPDGAARLERVLGLPAGTLGGGDGPRAPERTVARADA